jgi:hypothetical protein
MTEENPATFRRDARPPPESNEKLVQTVVITGMSGSGKSTALKAFEDIPSSFCLNSFPSQKRHRLGPAESPLSWT